MIAVRRWGEDDRTVTLEKLAVDALGQIEIERRLALSGLRFEPGRSAGALAMNMQGTEVAFDAVQNGRSAVFVWRTSSDHVRVVRRAEGVAALKWSPDGRSLLVQSFSTSSHRARLPLGRFSGIFDFAVVDAEGKTHGAVRGAMGATWMPDGRLGAWRLGRGWFTEGGDVVQARGGRAAFKVVGGTALYRDRISSVLRVMAAHQALASGFVEGSLGGQLVGTMAFSPDLRSAFVASCLPSPNDGGILMTNDVVFRASGAARLLRRRQDEAMYQIGWSRRRDVFLLGNPVYSVNVPSSAWESALFLTRLIGRERRVVRSVLVSGLTRLDRSRFAVAD